MGSLNFFALLSLFGHGLGLWFIHKFSETKPFTHQWKNSPPAHFVYLDPTSQTPVSLEALTSRGASDSLNNSRSLEVLDQHLSSTKGTGHELQNPSLTMGELLSFGNEPPNYPALALSHGWEGKLDLELHIGQDGHVEEVRLRNSSGYVILDKEAIGAAKRWKFPRLWVEENHSIAQVPVEFENRRLQK